CFMSYAFRTSGNAGALSRSVTVEVPMVGSASASRPTCFQGDKRMTDANIMKADANAALISSGYAAFARGAVQGALAVFAQYILWHIPVRGPLSRDYRGHAEVLGFFSHFMELSSGTFRIQVDDVLAKGDRVVVLCTESAQRGGRSWSSPQ